MATNEKLQGANEEYETSKEELQSMNEEMSTINAELTSKIEQLDRANNDLRNLFRATGVGVVVLDPDLHIQRFTPEATQLFRLLPADVGRPLADVRSRIGEDVLASARRVLEGGVEEEREVVRAEGNRMWIMRVLPYRSEGDRVEGVVLSFADVTSLRRIEGEKERLAEIVRYSQDAIVAKALDGTVSAWNAGAERLFGYTAAEAINRPVTDLIVPPGGEASLAEVLQRIRNGEQVEPYEVDRRTKDGRIIRVLVSVSAIPGPGGVPTGASAVMRDVTLRARTLEALQQSEQRLRLALASAPVFMATMDTALRYTWVHSSDTARPIAEMLGRTDAEVFEHPEDAESLTALKRAVLDGGERQRAEISLGIGGSRRWFDMTVEPLLDRGTIAGISIVAMEITRIKEAESGLTRWKHWVDTAVRASGLALYDWNHATGHISWGGETAALFGMSPEEMGERGPDWARLMHPADRDAFEAQIRVSLAAGTSFHAEYRMLHDDGHYVHVENRGDLVEGERWRMVGSVADVTSRIEANERDRQLAVIVTSSDDAILSVDPDGVVTSWNPAAERIYGYTAAEAVGRPLDFLVPEEAVGERTWLVNAIHRGERVRLREVERRRKDGTIATVLLTLSPLRDARDRLQGLALVERDITDRKLAQQALRMSETRFRTVLKGSPIYVYSQDRDLRYTWLSDTADQRNVEQMLGRTDAEILERPADVEVLVALKRRVLESGRGLRQEVTVRIAGRDRIYDLIVEPDRDATGAIVGVMGAGIDITERKQIEEQLRRAHKLQAVGKLAGGLAHEVNNMMQAVIGFGGIVRKRLGDDHPERGDVDEILNAARRAASLTQQLLAFSRQQVLQPRLVDIGEVVEEMQPTLERLLGADKVLTLDIGEPGASRVDRGQLEGVLVNLVLNARDATPPGGRVEISTRHSTLDDSYLRLHPGVEIRPGPYIVLAVSDTGSGMDDETRARVLEPFFTTKPVGQGTGLGLSTVYGIVKQSEGYVWIYSEPGEGTVVKVYLPLVDGAAGGQETGREERGAVALGGAETILIIEDEEIVRRMVLTELAEQGYRVVEAMNGAEGLDRIDAEPDIALVLCDVVMPVMSGKVVGEQVAAVRPDLPILYMSGYTGEDIVHRGLLDPSAEFISKPFAGVTLLRRVREMLDRASAR